MAAGGAPVTWETLAYASSLLSTLHRGALGEASTTPKTFLHLKNTDWLDHSNSVQNRVRIAEEQETQSLQMEYLEKVMSKTQEFYKEKIHVFQSISLHILPCCCVITHHLEPSVINFSSMHWSMSGTETTQIIFDVGKSFAMNPTEKWMNLFLLEV